MAIPILHLNRHVPHRTLHGHIWVYATEAARLDGVAGPGDLVEVRDPAGNAIGRGFYSPRSKIAVRLLTQRACAIDPAFFRARLQQALGHRERALPGRPARRLVNSEGDLLPGLIVDQYGDVLVVQTTTSGMDRLLPMWSDLLGELLRPRAILERNDLPVRAFEDLPLRTGVLRGEAVGALRLRIGALDFPCDPHDAHKTGVYLDQQCNWQAVAGLVRPGMRVLDAFCHLGGFGLHALNAGAGEAVLLDSSAASLGGARQAAEWAGSSARVRLVEDNAFGFLKGADGANERFDLIVLDPPSFTRTRAAVPQAMRGYKEIHLRALKMLSPGGVLATFSCSHHIAAPAFLAMVADAAGDAKRTLRRESLLGASPDHPVLAGVPESEYLKGAVFSVLDG